MKRLSVRRGGRELASGPLDQPLIAVGRSPACDVILRAPGVAPMHFLIDWIGAGAFDANEGEWTVSDASGSSQDDSSALKAQGAGLALSGSPVSFGGFEFALVEDRLQETALEPGILRETLEREGLANLDRGRSVGSLEIVRVQSDAQAVIGVVHAPRAQDGRIRLRGSAGAYLEWRDRDAIVVWPEAAGVEAFNRGRRVDPEPGSDDGASSRTLWLRAGDFVKLKLPTEEVFLRFVAPVSTDPIPQSILQDRLVRWLVGAVALASVLAFFGARKGTSERVMTFEEPRLARVELREAVAPTPVPTPVPLPTPGPTPIQQLSPSKSKPIAVVRPKPSAPRAPLAAGPRTPAPQPKPSGPSAGPSAAPRAKSEKPVAAPAQARSSAVRPSSAPPSAPSTDDAALAMLAGLKGASEARVTSDSLEKASGTESVSGGAGGGSNPNPRARVSVDEGGDVGGVDLSKASRGVGTGGGAGAPSLASGLGKGEGAGRFALGGGQGGTALRMEFGGTGARVSGGLSRDVVREAVARRRPSFRACIEAAGLPRSERPRSISFDIQIDPKGGVSSVRLASSDFASASFESCMSRALKATSFPAAANGRETSVYYPFLFKG